MTTATTWRKERGRETERLVAAYLRDHGWPYAEPVGAGRPGADITGTPGLLPEIKATRACSPVAWLNQSHNHALIAGDGHIRDEPLPFAIWRPDGFGPKQIGQWPVMIELGEFTRLLRAAGYGDSDADQ